MPVGPQEFYRRAMRACESVDQYFPGLVAEAAKAKAKKIAVPRGVYEFAPNEHGRSGPAHWQIDGLTDGYEAAKISWCSGAVMKSV